MTLKNTILVAFAAITLTALSAGAYIVPGRPPVRPGPHPGGRQDQKIIYINSRVVNEVLHLRQLAGLGEQYNGYTVESVVLDVRASGPRAELSLLTDGRLEETVYSPRGIVHLQPRFGTVLGQDIRTLQLDVRGVADIQSITINLVRGDRYDRPGRPGRTVDVPLYISRHLSGNDRLDITPYIDMNRYRGYKIEVLEVDASTFFGTSYIDVVINGFFQRPTLQVTRYSTRQALFPQNAILGRGADSIVFYSRGDLDIHGVTLRLSRP